MNPNHTRIRILHYIFHNCSKNFAEFHGLGLCQMQLDGPQFGWDGDKYPVDPEAGRFAELQSYFWSANPTICNLEFMPV